MPSGESGMTPESKMGGDMGFLRQQRIERVEKLSDKIDNKIRIIADLEDMIEKGKNMLPDEFEKFIEEVKLKIIDSFDQKTRDAAKLMLFEEKEREEALNKLLESEDFDLNDNKEDAPEEDEEDDTDFEQIFDKLISDINTRDDYTSEDSDKEPDEPTNDPEGPTTQNADVVFLFRVLKYFDYFKGKRAEAERVRQLYNTDKPAFFEDIAHQISEDPGKLADITQEVRFSPYSVNLIVDPKYFGNGTRGEHCKNTVINLIGQRPGLESTIAHEENHNLLNISDSQYSEKLIDRIQKFIYYYEIFGDDKEHDSLEAISRMVVTQASHNYEEFLADFTSDRQRTGHTFYHHFEIVITDIWEFAEKQDPEIKSAIMDGIDQSISIFVQKLGDISDILSVAYLTGQEKLAQYAFILFGLGENNHIKRLFKSKVGQKIYDFAMFAKPVMHEKFPEAILGDLFDTLLSTHMSESLSSKTKHWINSAYSKNNPGLDEFQIAPYFSKLAKYLEDPDICELFKASENIDLEMIFSWEEFAKESLNSKESSEGEKEGAKEILEAIAKVRNAIEAS